MAATSNDKSNGAVVKAGESLLPHLESLDRVMKLPVIEAAWTQSQGYYDKMRGECWKFSEWHATFLSNWTNCDDVIWKLEWISVPRCKSSRKFVSMRRCMRRRAVVRFVLYNNEHSKSNYIDYEEAFLRQSPASDIDLSRASDQVSRQLSACW